QRTIPVACLALEEAALSGRTPEIDAAGLFASVSRTDNNGQLEELAYRLRLPAGPNASTRATPYVLMAAGRWTEAAEQWGRLGWPYQQAEALAGSPVVEDQLAALEILDRIGAVPLAQLIRRRLRATTDVRVPRGPSRDSRTDPDGLTARQQAVFALLADGLTNAAIAERLVVSVRTVDSHVAAILAKLGVSTRQEAAALARRRHR
ncbi:MAG: LuxR family transcriptional regulator, partial [Actinobacteria bacterium]|nr:LuxR family transcriptional regulator [Actinomycetota bacterium]